jgi:hypothetical protein
MWSAFMVWFFSSLWSRFYFHFFLVVLWFEYRVPCLLYRYSPAWAIPFLLYWFWRLIFDQTSLDGDPPILCFQLSLDVTHHHVQLLSVDMEVSWTFFARAGTTILPISTSQVAKIIYVSHQHLAETVFFFFSHKFM